MIVGKYLSIGGVASLIGVCTKTLRRWDRNGILCPSFRTAGNHRRYDRQKILKFLGLNKNYNNLTINGRSKMDIRAAIYARVSSSRQKNSGELDRQISNDLEYCRCRGYSIVEKFSDVGSGLNDNRKGLLRLLKEASLGKFDVIVVSYNDRLARFGLQIIREYLTSWNVKLEIINPIIIESSPHAELITDLTSILYSFMGKLYRLRRK